MHLQALTGLVDSIVYTFGFTLPYLAGAAIVFAVLSRISPATRAAVVAQARPRHRSGLLGVHPGSGAYARIGFTVLFTVAFLGIASAGAIADFYAHGHGPLAALPLWLQIVLYLLVSDFLLYWIHRAFHGTALWRFHACIIPRGSGMGLGGALPSDQHHFRHHAGRRVDAGRGIKPDVFFFLIPFTTLSSVFVHAISIGRWDRSNMCW